jgi:hypothetical protein
MRSLAVAFLLTACIGVPHPVFAGDVKPTQPPAKASGPALGNRLQELLEKLGITVISKARAAECIEEGETCTANEQCCAGLQCVGGPPATCSLEE